MAQELSKRQSFATQQAKDRDAAIQRWYREGGKWFFEWTAAYYRRETGEALNWNEPYHPEFYYLLGNPWIEPQVYEKGSQVGYTEALIAFVAFLLTAVKVSTGLGFEAERKLRRMIPRIQRSFDYIEPLQKAREAVRQATSRKDVDNKEYQVSVAGVSGSFFYASTQSKDKNTRQASSSMSSFTAWVLCCDEIELFPEGALDVARKRQGACPMPTKPLRSGSTPGHQGGLVDSMVKASKYLFQWSVECPHCQKRQFLNPFGNLLKAVMRESEDGGEEEAFLDVTGRPLDWFCRDKTNRQSRIATAYIGCVHCDGELPFEVMKYAWAEKEEAKGTGYFACRNTGIMLKELMEQVLRDRTPIKDSVALRLPRLASALFNAPDMIQALIKTRNPSDEVQQGLGLAVSIGSGKMSLVRLQKCIGLPMPEWCEGRSPDMVVMGVDQGRAHQVVVRAAWYFPPEERDPELKWLGAHVRLDWWGYLMGFDGLSNHAQQHGVSLLGMDSEPEIQLAAAFAKKHPPGQAEVETSTSSEAVSQIANGMRNLQLNNLMLAFQLEDFLVSLGCQIVTKQERGSVIDYCVKFPSISADRLKQIDLFLSSNFSIVSIEQYRATDLIWTPKREKKVTQFKVFLFDQVELKGEGFRRAERVIQDEKVPMFAMHRTFGLDAVRDRIYRKQFHLPEGINYDPTDEDNLLVHLLASDRTTNGLWKQTPGIPDHFHHALSFAELCVLASFYEPKPRKFSFGKLDRP
jgi:hypothetical protein